MTRLTRESGQASIELVGLLPLLLLVAVVVVQVGIAGFCLRATTNSARAGARAASLCQDGVRAAVTDPPTWLRDDVQAVVNRSAGSVRVRVQTQIPVLFSSFTLPGPVQRDATFPQSEDC